VIVENKINLKDFYGEETWELFKGAVRNCSIRWNTVLAETFSELEKEKIEPSIKGHFDSALYISIITNMLVYKFLTLALDNPERAKQAIEIDLLTICDTVRQSMEGSICDAFLEKSLS